jgi:hypothetical protein
MAIPCTQWDDADYVIILKGFNGKDSVIQRFEVSRIDYESIDIYDGINVINEKK